MEIELKFRTDPKTLVLLSSLKQLGDFHLGAQTMHYDQDRYYDTATYAFLNAGYACRIRERNGRPIATLKGLGGAKGATHEREELEVFLDAAVADPTRWPASPARTKATAIAQGAALIQLFTLSQERYTRPIRQEGREIALLSLDSVSVARPNHQSPLTWAEVEIELVNGVDPAVLPPLAAALQQAAAVTPVTHSKFAQALLGLELIPAAEARYPALTAQEGQAEALPDPPPPTLAKPAHQVEAPVEAPRPPTLTAQTTLAEAGRMLLLAQVAVLRRQEPLAQAGEVDGVHDMRVATRRIRSLLRMVAEAYRPKLIQRLRRKVRQLADDLGRVRDADVALAHLGAYLEIAPDAQPHLQPLIDGWQQARNRALGELQAFLASLEYHSLLNQLDAFGQAPKVDRMAGQVALAVRLPTLLWEHYGVIRAYEMHYGADLSVAPVEERHEVRIAAKRLRYALEFFAPVLGDEVGSLRKTLVRLQDVVGNERDALLATERVRAFLTTQKTHPTGLTAAAEAYLTQVTHDAETWRAQLPDAWHEVRRRRFRRKLGKAVAGV